MKILRVAKKMAIAKNCLTAAMGGYGLHPLKV
jgi:hypothetical protein